MLQEEGADPARSVIDGTSFSAPQVAGLAAYLWQLDDSLRSQPVSQTIRHLQANARSNGLVPTVLDAYGSVLALDSRRGDQRMRRELVDVVVSGELRYTAKGEANGSRALVIDHSKGTLSYDSEFEWIGGWGPPTRYVG